MYPVYTPFSKGGQFSPFAKAHFYSSLIARDAQQSTQGKAQ